MDKFELDLDVFNCYEYLYWSFVYFFITSNFLHLDTIPFVTATWSSKFSLSAYSLTSLELYLFILESDLSFFLSLLNNFSIFSACSIFFCYTTCYFLLFFSPKYFELLALSSVLLFVKTDFLLLIWGLFWSLFGNF